MALYSKNVMNHFKNPRNMGKMKNPDGKGIAGNILCGDSMYLYIKVKDEKITDVRWEAFGCAAAISSSSVVSELAKNKTITQALKLTNKDVLRTLGALPAPKVHCSFLAIDALKEAVYNYLSKKKLLIPKQLQKDHKRITGVLKKIEERMK